MKKSFLLILALVGLLTTGCHKPQHVVSVTTEAIAINADLDSLEDAAYLEVLAPISAELDREMNVVIGYAPEDMEVHAPECKMLNWATDALYAKAQQYYPGEVHFAVVNIGGMRTPWKAGDITRRHIFELMPFDNELVVLTLSGEDVIDLCQVFATDGGQGVSGLRMVAEDKQLADVTIHGEPVQKDAYYHVATSDYLAGGTDHMIPLTHATEIWRSNLKIRDLYLDYVQEVKTVTATIDGRMNVY